MRRLACALVVAIGCASSPPRPVEPPERLEQPTSPTSEESTRPHQRGRWDEKRREIHERLEQMSPPPGKTALKTRAHPFASYLVQVHNALHARWGFGFIRSLEEKPAGDPLNDAKLATTVEIIIAANGTLEGEPRIIQSSGLPAFDRAAQEAFVAAAPFAATPAEIRSYDGKVRVRWTLFRDQRQCSTYFADPIILDAPP